MTRILGTPVPSGFVFDTAPSGALAVPWPIYAFGAAPFGLLVGAAAAAVLCSGAGIAATTATSRPGPRTAPPRWRPPTNGTGVGGRRQPG